MQPTHVHSIQSLPTEILINIYQKCGEKEAFKQWRTVSRLFQAVATEFTQQLALRQPASINKKILPIERCIRLREIELDAVVDPFFWQKFLEIAPRIPTLNSLKIENFCALNFSYDNLNCSQFKTLEFMDVNGSVAKKFIMQPQTTNLENLKYVGNQSLVIKEAEFQQIFHANRLERLILMDKTSSIELSYLELLLKNSTHLQHLCVHVYAPENNLDELCHLLPSSSLQSLQLILSSQALAEVGRMISHTSIAQLSSFHVGKVFSFDKNFENHKKQSLFLCETTVTEKNLVEFFNQKKNLQRLTLAFNPNLSFTCRTPELTQFMGSKLKGLDYFKFLKNQTPLQAKFLEILLENATSLEELHVDLGEDLLPEHIHLLSNCKSLKRVTLNLTGSLNKKTLKALKNYYKMINHTNQLNTLTIHYKSKKIYSFPKIEKKT